MFSARINAIRIAGSVAGSSVGVALGTVVGVCVGRGVRVASAPGVNVPVGVGSDGLVLQRKVARQGAE
jgi:hypothetical protein